MPNVETVVGGCLSSTSYIIQVTDGCWVVDCGDYPALKLHLMNAIKGVLLTHAHFDHIRGLNELLIDYPDIKIYTNETGREMLLNARKNLSFYHESPFVISEPSSIVTVEDNDEVEIGEDPKAKVVFSPGHNPSCITWIVGDSVFTGDSFIPGIKTVTNLPGGNKTDATYSIEIIKRLSIGKVIYPGHKI